MLPHLIPRLTAAAAAVITAAAGRSRGFGFVEFRRSDDADAARRALDGKDHPTLGLIMVNFVNPAKSQDRRANGGINNMAGAPGMGGRGRGGGFGGRGGRFGDGMMGGRGGFAGGRGRGEAQDADWVLQRMLCVWQQHQ
jgi:hypothetical protein